MKVERNVSSGHCSRHFLIRASVFSCAAGRFIALRISGLAWHYHILNDRSLTGLPRKFNVAFDGAGKIAVLEDTNDIAFSAVEVKEGFGVEAGVWFRLGLGGITGHKDFAKYADIIVKPADATKVADAIVRVFIDTGDRTNRLKARMKYVIDGIGMGSPSMPPSMAR